MSKLQYKLTCNFQLDPNTFVQVADELEISLPCINCQRDRRTIIFEDLDVPGICTPRKKCNGFPGKLSKREVTKTSNGVHVNYLIDFDYTPFIDRKYNMKVNFEFGWARVYFTIKCAQCDRENTISSQENLVRPWHAKCDCGNIIFKDVENPFTYEVIE